MNNRIDTIRQVKNRGYCTMQWIFLVWLGWSQTKICIANLCESGIKNKNGIFGKMPKIELQNVIMYLSMIWLRSHNAPEGYPKKGQHLKLFNLIWMLTRSIKKNSLDYLVISSITSNHMNMLLLHKRLKMPFWWQ